VLSVERNFRLEISNFKGDEFYPQMNADERRWEGEDYATEAQRETALTERGYNCCWLLTPCHQQQF
jgi:hypothetical protein